MRQRECFHPDGAFADFVLGDLLECAVGFDAVGAEAVVGLAGDVEELAEFVDGERARHAFAGGMADQLEPAVLRVYLKPNDAVTASGFKTRGDIAIGDVEIFRIGRQVQIRGGDGSGEPFRLGDDVLHGREPALLGVPLPRTDAGLLAFVSGVGD